LKRGGKIAATTVAAAALAVGAVGAHDPRVLVRALAQRQRVHAGLGRRGGCRGRCAVREWQPQPGQAR
jgi:hypothetical protein